MAFECRVYLNSGFNSVNIPDTYTRLNSLSYVDVDPLQINQERFLSYIDVKANYDTIKNADYLQVAGWFYSINDIQMITPDTARFSLTPDFLTSAGGVINPKFTLLDGITNRVHVSTDEYGEWTEADPYMAPARTLDLVTARTTYTGDTEGSYTYIPVVKSSLDISEMGTATAKTGVTYTDDTTGETVTVPSVVSNDGTDDTTYYIDLSTLDDPTETVSDPTQILGESKTKLFNVNMQAVQDGLREINNLGVTGAVTSQVLLPSRYVTVVSQTDGTITSATGRDIYTSITTEPYEYSGASNKKIDYSEYTPYGILASSGAKKEFLPASIYVSGLTSPVLRCISDPRTDGKPYFRFSSFMGDTKTSRFFFNAVAGTPWKEVPLTYDGASGRRLMDLQYSQTMNELTYQGKRNADETYWTYNQNIWNKAGDAIGSVFSTGVQGGASGILEGDKVAGLISGMTGIISSTVGGAAQMSNIKASYQHNLERVQQQFNHDMQTEKANYLLQTNVYTPTVQFSFSSDLYNDLYNNSCIVYRYQYSDFDIARIDKILTMYGYKVTKALELSDFTNREYFNYVESTCTVTGLPKWWADGISAQLSAGVRVWHTKPDPQYFTNNPIST